MATGKKYYWIKLKTDFMTSDKVDYLMSQTNGAEYVVLYQMLCMKCINTDGVLVRQIGEVIIPFDAEKIARDCKYFSVDTVKMAFQLFIQLGMIYQESNGYLRIADFENMVGSETDWAAQKRKQVKSKDNILIESGNTVETDVEKFHTDIRERDKRLDIDINSKSSAKTGGLSDFTVLKNCWNDCYIQLFNKKPDENLSSEKQKSFWAGVVKQIKSKLTQYDVDTLDAAIRYAALESWVVNGGFLIHTVLSDAVILKSISNAPHSGKNQFNNVQQKTQHVDLSGKISLGDYFDGQ